MSASNSSGDQDWWMDQARGRRRAERSFNDELELDSLRHEALIERSRRLELEAEAHDQVMLRNENPGLKELWNQYQTMLRLVRKRK